MSRDYHTDQVKHKNGPEIARGRLEHISQLLPHSDKLIEERVGRNILTRAIDATLVWVRRYFPILHWLGAALTAFGLFLYVRLVAFTARLLTTGERHWPDLPVPCVMAVWHSDAPTLLVAYAKHRLTAPAVIMIAQDPRGDYLALLCRLLRLEVVRGASHEGGWEALLQLAARLAEGATVILTADGGGPARAAKVGAVALSSATGVPLIPVVADCRPAIVERHKWDAARNPIPFCCLTIKVGPGRKFDLFQDSSSVEEARVWLEKTLNALGTG